MPFLLNQGKALRTIYSFSLVSEVSVLPVFLFSSLAARASATSSSQYASRESSVKWSSKSSPFRTLSVRCISACCCRSDSSCSFQKET